MNQHLFTYGSLRPGEQYAHLLETASGHWQKGSVRGFIDANGWGCCEGYPALVLDDSGNLIHGMVLTSTALQQLWPVLDEFEGEAYERARASVKLDTGQFIKAHLYVLSANLRPAFLSAGN